MPRPNVGPRPVCRYYSTPRGCFAGDSCHYLHGDPAVQKHAPYEENKTCRFYTQGYCKRGSDCWFKHVASEMASVSGPSLTRQGEVPKVAAEEISCAICYEEKPVLYGLLSGCSHAFCLPCIRRWRDPEGKGVDMQESGTHKTCPMCRASTKFIVPASLFYSQGDPRKEEIMEKYKQSMARVPCRYFTRSRSGKRFCPFGRDCFYQHANADGTPYEFTHGVDVMMPQWQRREREAGANSTSNNLFRDPLEAALEVLEGFAETLSEGSDRTDESNRNTLARRAAHDFMTRLVRFDPFTQQVTAFTPEEELHYREEHAEEEAEEPLDPLPFRDGIYSAEQTETSRPSTPISSSPATSSEPQTAVSSESEFHSEDPRSPVNASRSGQLTTGDFAWMMEERREEGCDHTLLGDG